MFNKIKYNLKMFIRVLVGYDKLEYKYHKECLERMLCNIKILELEGKVKKK